MKPPVTFNAIVNPSAGLVSRIEILLLQHYIEFVQNLKGASAINTLKNMHRTGVKEFTLDLIKIGTGNPPSKLTYCTKVQMTMNNLAGVSFVADDNVTDNLFIAIAEEVAKDPTHGVPKELEEFFTQYLTSGPQHIVHGFMSSLRTKQSGKSSIQQTLASSAKTTGKYLQNQIHLDAKMANMVLHSPHSSAMLREVGPSTPDNMDLTALLSAYVMVCDCKLLGSTIVSRAFCPSATKALSKQISRTLLVAKLKKTQQPNSASGADLLVPLFGLVLHRIHVKLVTLPQWDDTTSTKLLVMPRVYNMPDMSRYYEVEDSANENPLQDQIDVLEECLTAEQIEEIHLAGNSHMCASKHHNYGTNKTCTDWLKSANTEPEAMNRMRAMAFCRAHYGLCFFCYKRTETTFSLMDDNFV